jgi:hypothetical protein
MARKKFTPFAHYRDGQDLYIRMKYSGIHPLVVLYDGISLHFFGKEKTGYLLVEDAVAWHEKELQETNGRAGNRQVMELLRAEDATIAWGGYSVSGSSGSGR